MQHAPSQSQKARKPAVLAANSQWQRRLGSSTPTYFNLIPSRTLLGSPPGSNSERSREGHNRIVQATAYSSSRLAPQSRACCEMPCFTLTGRVVRRATTTQCHSLQRSSKRHHALPLSLLLIINIFNIVSCTVPSLSCSKALHSICRLFGRIHCVGMAGHPVVYQDNRVVSSSRSIQFMEAFQGENLMTERPRSDKSSLLLTLSRSYNTLFLSNWNIAPRQARDTLRNTPCATASYQVNNRPIRSRPITEHSTTASIKGIGDTHTKVCFIPSCCGGYVCLRQDVSVHAPPTLLRRLLEEPPVLIIDWARWKDCK